MPENLPSSSLIDRLSPNAARLVLVLLIMTAAALVWVSLGIGEPVKRPGPTDLDTYQRVVAALRDGQNYYAALHDALLDGGYGTLSPFNWRTPPFLTMLSWFPSLESAQLFLIAITIGAWMMAVGLIFRRDGFVASIAAGIVLAASLLSIGAYRAELSFELCAGTLILISVSAYGLGWRRTGFAAAVLALFVRDLAGLYTLVCLGMALRQRRWREVMGWAVALVAYAALYLWHWAQLTAWIGPEDHAAAAGWLQFGGLVFALRTAAFNGILLVMPYWVAALALVAGLAGLLSMPRAFATVVAYLMLFTLYGRPENNYWGGLYAPLIALGVVRAAPLIKALLARSRRLSGAAPAGAPRSGSLPPSADGSAR
jgi:hypothetical protein